jgi:Fe-S-cluster-containing dehydrogenase component
MCIVACPFGEMRYDEDKRRVIKCDFCDGDPICVKACSTDALLFVDATDANMIKKLQVIEKFSEEARRFL